MTQQQKDSAGVPEVAGQIARAKLGIEQLRPGQEEAIAAVLAGHDTLAVMPTGSGKSAIYQFDMTVSSPVHTYLFSL